MSNKIKNPMKPFVRNILAFVVSLITGSFANSLIISFNGTLIPLPEGADVSNMEGLAASMELFEPIHFLMPFLAHAIGTLVGAYIVARFAATRGDTLAWIIGALFFTGGCVMVFQLPAPMWFNVTDLVFAYFPMSYLGIKLASKK
jgi:hypothetical protein